MCHKDKIQFCTRKSYAGHIRYFKINIEVDENKWYYLYVKAIITTEVKFNLMMMHF